MLTHFSTRSSFLPAWRRFTTSLILSLLLCLLSHSIYASWPSVYILPFFFKIFSLFPSLLCILFSFGLMFVSFHVLACLNSPLVSFFFSMSPLGIFFSKETSHEWLPPITNLDYNSRSMMMMMMMIVMLIYQEALPLLLFFLHRSNHSS